MYYFILFNHINYKSTSKPKYFKSKIIYKIENKNQILERMENKSEIGRDRNKEGSDSKRNIDVGFRGSRDGK